MKTYLSLFISVLAITAICMGVGAPASVYADPVDEREAELRAELAQIEEDIKAQQKILSEQQRKSTSLERDVAILNAQIREAQLKIQARNLSINRLGDDIVQHSQTIEELTEEIEKGKESLAQLIRKTDEIDDYSLVEMLLSNQDMSEFFADLDSFDTIQQSLHQAFIEIKEARAKAEAEKEELGRKRVEETDAKMAVEAERATIQRKEEERRRLLNISKSEEQTHEQFIAERERQAAEIRSALFALRDAAAIPFGQALEYANRVHRLTGVRPAFLLSIIKQESNLGENVGTCNRPGDSLTWRDIMPGPDDNSWRDDQTAFARLMDELGRPTDGTPLSCPLGHGWGGAMGPSQFIPATWASYQSRIADTLGVAVPDPWNPQHAFTASALYLRDLGAANGGYSAEREAALRYYAGGNWNDPRNAFYGDQVMRRVEELQADIDILEGR